MDRWFFAILVPTLVILLHAFLPQHWPAGQRTPQGSRPGKVLGEDPGQFDLATGSQNLRTLENQAAPGGEAQYRVRIVYAVPENRSAQPDAEENLAGFVRKTQAWFADNMELMGYGRKTFVYETESDSDDPLIHEVELAAGYVLLWRSARHLGRARSSESSSLRVCPSFRPGSCGGWFPDPRSGA